MCVHIKDIASKRHARKSSDAGLPLKAPSKVVVYRLRKLACAMYRRLRTIKVSRETQRPLRQV